jgi:hypothetical protein
LEQEKLSDQKPPKPNPVRDSKNKVKLAVFAINGQGAAFTFHPDRFDGSWDANVRLAKMADKLGFEAFVSSSASRLSSLPPTGSPSAATDTIPAI